MREAEAALFFGQASSRLPAQRLSERLPYPVHWIQSFPKDDQSQHVTAFIRSQLRALGWPARETAVHIDPPLGEIAAATEWMKQVGLGEDCRPVLIHPGSGGRKKIWPLKRWWALLVWLRQECKIPVLLTLGPADDYLAGFANEARQVGVHVLENLSLPRLSAFLSCSRLYVGNDSGVSHLAGLVGVPTVAVFGPTNPEVWAPTGPCVHVVRSCRQEGESLDRPPADPFPPHAEQVMDVVGKILD
jgi:ADP-heptose:LPS heptosyltransferase